MRRALAALALTGALVASGTPGTIASAASPSFAKGPCPSSVPASPRIECGMLTVPEVRGASDAGTVEMAVAIIHPPAPAKPGTPPLLMAPGGPGDSGLQDAAGLLDEPLVTDRDTILFDPRGVGSSKPSLGCPEISAAPGPSSADEIEQSKQDYLDAVTVCHQRLVAEGVHLRSYDYPAITADLTDLRKALGIEEWNVYGISNGGRIALELVRRHPKGVRALVLDASLPPQGNYYTELWPHADRAFKELFSACARDSGCNAAHPDLENVFWDLVKRLRDEPAVGHAVNPLTGANQAVVIDDLYALELMRSALYDPSLIPVIPSLIDLLSKGEGTDLIANEVVSRTPSPGSFSDGEGFSDNCREEVAFIEPGEFARQARAMPKFRRAIGDTAARIKAECDIWKVGKGPASVNQPVRSDIPALIFVGQFDPVHPLASSKAIHKYLKNSQIIEVPGVGHGAVRTSECSLETVRKFFGDPTGNLAALCRDEGRVQFS